MSVEPASVTERRKRKRKRRKKGSCIPGRISYPVRFFLLLCTKVKRRIKNGRVLLISFFFVKFS